MNYIVSDTSMGPTAADAVIGTVEANSPSAAKIAALRAISSSMDTFVSEMLFNDAVGFATHVMADLEAVPA